MLSLVESPPESRTGQEAFADPESVHQAQRHAQRLIGGGLSTRRIGILAGIADGSVRRLLAADPASDRVAVSSVEKVLAVIVPAPVGLVRRMQALAFMGWCPAELSRRSGVDSSTISRIMTGVACEVDSRRLVELFDRLAMLPASGQHAERVRDTARRAGWVSVLAWDDVDDPHARPVGVSRQQRPSQWEADDVEWLLDSGLSPVGVARELGASVASVRRTLARRGRDDVSDRLAPNRDTPVLPERRFRVDARR